MNLPLIFIGAVTRAQGLKGALRVVPYLTETDVYEGLERVVLQQEDRREEHDVRACRCHGRVVILELEGIENRTDAEAYVGTQIYVDRRQLRDLGADEFYKEDVLGLLVMTESGQALGEVIDFIDTGSNDVLVVSGPSKEHLIPLLSSVIKTVDLEARTITVVGLKELYEESPEDQ
jgi:16S rRNA processing protein RimM